MKTIVSILTVFALFCSGALCCDQTDPICVASKIYEAGATFQTEGVKKYYCEDNLELYEVGLLLAKSMEKTMKAQGIDYFKQVYHDFSNVKYEIKEIDPSRVIVNVSGKCTAGFKNTDFETTLEVKESFYLIKPKGSENYCFPKNGKINNKSS